MSEDIEIYHAGLEADMQGELTPDHGVLASDEDAPASVPVLLDPNLPPEIHPALARLWQELTPTPGQPHPSTRAIRAALKDAGVRMSSTSVHAQLQRLRATSLAGPTASDGVAEAEERLAQAQQAVQAVETEFIATEAQVAQLDQTVATLIARASAGDGEAAQAIPETKETLKLTLRTLELQLPRARAQVENSAKAAEQALQDACNDRDMADYNRLMQAEAVLAQAVMDAVEVLHERAMELVAHHLAARQIAGRLHMPYGERPSPEERLAAYLLGQLADVAPPYPQRVGSRLPAVPDLVEGSSTGRALSPQEFAALRGTGRVYVQYRGTRIVDWSGCERGPAQRQQAFQHHQPVSMSLADYAIMLSRYGADDLWTCPAPLWEL